MTTATVKCTGEIRRLLLIGLIASVITVLGGELPIGWVLYPQVEGDVTGLTGMMLGSAGLSMVQLFCGALFAGSASRCSITALRAQPGWWSGAAAGKPPG